MIVLKGKNGGFCFGVARAVKQAKQLSGKGNYILGQIIHNESVINELERAGIKTINSLNDANFCAGDNLLIRTHGEGKETFDYATKLGLNIIDCTCPFVKEIHDIVKKNYADGYTVAVIGNAEHPEVKGINGWCGGTAVITESSEVLSQIQTEKLCIVVQTTYSEEKFDEIIKNFANSNAKTVDIFKTICYTTKKRQKEAEILSAKCEAVLVLGGANSNNTNKLYDICKKNCNNVFRLVSPVDFDYEKIKSYNKVGVVLGASTPIEQFREVVSLMENVKEEVITTQTVEGEVKQEEVKETVEVATVAETKNVSAVSEMEKAFSNIKPNKDLKIGQIVSAVITSAKDDGLTLSIKDSKKDDFSLPKSEIMGEYDKEAYQAKVGQKIRVMVIAKQPVVFSEKAMESVLKEEAEIEEIKNGKIFEAVIKSTNKGGLNGEFGRYSVFVPASQIKLGFVKDLEKYVGKTLRLKAEKVESRGSRRQIVGSQKVILEAEKAERDAIKAKKESEFFASIQEGDVVLGTPVRFAAFGAFVDVNGFDCLAHISDLSWTGCSDCAEVLELGKQAEFKILKIDEENKRVSIGYKQLQPKPWDTVVEKYNVDDVITGKVVRIVSFGAFVEIEKGVDGLVHVSQISNQWLENPVTALQVGQEVQAKIMAIDPEKEKMTLSIKALLPEVEKPEKEDKKGKKGKDNAETEEDYPELREWKDDSGNGVSIAEMLGNNEN
ncbi:MAG: 4-hydroxy-3-methylbut-2-enyl diphosphate reductase [Clostridiales bacterium]|nr:4-hydroxy-3-methylbut-2-enyl diphosphate reductase [Clostridiales bacterium]